MNRMLMTVFLLICFFLFSSFVSEIAIADWIDPHLSKYHTVYPRIDPTFFPICPRPRGATQAFYKEGIHAIVANSELQTGADIVYSIGNDNYVQCFCPTEGWAGIQTNWLATTNINDEKKQDVVKWGWYFISNGADWGLKPVPYLAQNSDFLCLRPLFNPNQ